MIRPCLSHQLAVVQRAGALLVRSTSDRPTVPLVCSHTVIRTEDFKTKIAHGTKSSADARHLWYSVPEHLTDESFGIRQTQISFSVLSLFSKYALYNTNRLLYRPSLCLTRSLSPLPSSPSSLCCVSAHICPYPVVI